MVGFMYTIILLLHTQGWIKEKLSVFLPSLEPGSSHAIAAKSESATEGQGLLGTSPSYRTFAYHFLRVFLA